MEFFGSWSTKLLTKHTPSEQVVKYATLAPYPLRAKDRFEAVQ